MTDTTFISPYVRIVTTHKYYPPGSTLIFRVTTRQPSFPKLKTDMLTICKKP